jgi:glutamate 5-kinase
LFTGLYTSNPNTDPNAKRIEVVENINELDVDVGGAGSSVGTGGMVTKLTAARIACAAGCKTIVCLSSNLEKDVGGLRAPRGERRDRVSSREDRGER